MAYRRSVVRGCWVGGIREFCLVIGVRWSSSSYIKPGSLLLVTCRLYTDYLTAQLRLIHISIKLSRNDKKNFDLDLGQSKVLISMLVTIGSYLLTEQMAEWH